MRTTSIVDDVLKKIRNQNKNYLKPLCGLPISPYFSALKLKWLLENVPRVREALNQQRCMFGTIDSWLIWVSSIMIVYRNFYIIEIFMLKLETLSYL